MRGFVRGLRTHPVLTAGAVVLGVLEFVALQRSLLGSRAQQQD
jgi:hypothetical protein